MTLFKISQENGRHVIILFGLKITFKKLFLNQLADSCFISNLDYFKKQGTQFPHPTGIVINKEVKIGKNCIIFQNVTIGTWKDGNPTIGNNVIIYANSVIFGNITIGDNVIIGAGSVVTKSIDSNCTVAGNPAKIIKHIKNKKEVVDE